MLKHSSILYTVRNVYSYKLFSYILSFFAASKMTECFKNVTESFQEIIKNYTRSTNFINFVY